MLPDELDFKGVGNLAGKGGLLSSHVSSAEL